jgi:putative iron-dependent peroxidase
MVVGQPPGNYDHLLDFTHPVTGSTCIAPSVQFLSDLANGQSVELLPTAAAPAQARATPERTGTLSIGSLRGVPQHE